MSELEKKIEAILKDTLDPSLDDYLSGIPAATSAIAELFAGVEKEKADAKRNVTWHKNKRREELKELGAANARVFQLEAQNAELRKALEHMVNWASFSKPLLDAEEVLEKTK